MAGDAIEKIQAVLRTEKEIPINLKIDYKVVFSSLQGNLPINNRLWGSILDLPINLTLDYKIIPNTGGSFPVNSRLHGTIGDRRIDARLPHKIVFSSIETRQPAGVPP